MPQLSALFNGKWIERVGCGLIILWSQILHNHHSINQSDNQISTQIHWIGGLISTLMSNIIEKHN